MNKTFLIAATLWVAAFSANAQVEIVDSRPIAGAKPLNTPQTSANSQSASQSAQAMADANAELYYQVQLMQQEILELRGLVEEQAHEIKRLKQQRLDDYVDLDRRISKLSQGGASSLPVAPSATNSTSSSSNSTPVSQASPANELASYRTAIDLVIKKKDFDAGIQALNRYLADYPSGHYVANAYYWLGQIYLQKDQLADSETWFRKMVDHFPNHQKAGEAKFKLGKVYDMMGDKAQAKSLLQEVAAEDTAVADLAREYLKQNF